ncbi:uncharacterized protein LOC131891313 [Tigriopus californicus]|uniref:uncharacterized protein LOC131891313 n=1 Tax=Tigriopus californicus TaxID=6832 RepID=UPI0027D9E3F1|nr:uncharacterized protein LOC131891313 [Tigriopus californicus]
MAWINIFFIIVLVQPIACLHPYHAEMAISSILAEMGGTFTVLDDGKSNFGIPDRCQRIIAPRDDPSIDLLQVLAKVQSLFVVDLNFGPRFMEALAIPELHEIAIITQNQRQAFPYMLQQKATIFVLNQSYDDQMLFEVWSPGLNSPLYNLWIEGRGVLKPLPYHSPFTLKGIDLRFVAIYPDVLPPMERMIVRALQQKYQFQRMTATIPVDNYALSISEYLSIPIADLKQSISKDCEFHSLFDQVPQPSEQYEEGIEEYEYYNNAWKWACLGFQPNMSHMINRTEEDWEIQWEDDLLRGKAHFSIGFFPVQNDLFTSLLYRSIAYANYDEYALTRTPQPKNNLLNLMQVLDRTTWISLACGLLLFVVFAYGFSLVYNFLGLGNLKRPTFMDIFLVMFSGFTEPDPIRWFNNQNKGGLVLTLTWSVFAFIMTVSYSSMLLSFLTLPSSEQVVQSERDILTLEKTILVYPFNENGADLEYLKSFFPLDVALWANDHKDILFSIDEEELKYKILTLGNVLIDTKRGVLDGNLFSEYLEKIRFSAHPVTFGTNDDCLAIGKGFPWTDLILNDMLRMSAGGIFEYFFYFGISPKNLQILQPRDTAQVTSINVPINLDQVTFIFLFWTGGMTISGLVFLMEQI